MSEPDRLTLLEERYAHLQRHVLEQDKAMLALNEELDVLRREVALLRAAGTGSTPAPGDDPGPERPPHY